MKKLSSLDLRFGCLNDDDVAAMQDKQAAFAHLDLLNLHDNSLTKKAKTQGLAKVVNLGKQDLKRAGRFASEGE